MNMAEAFNHTRNKSACWVSNRGNYLKRSTLRSSISYVWSVMFLHWPDITWLDWIGFNDNVLHQLLFDGGMYSSSALYGIVLQLLVYKISENSLTNSPKLKHIKFPVIQTSEKQQILTSWNREVYPLLFFQTVHVLFWNESVHGPQL